MNKFSQYGICYGVVSDNADPEGLGRIKVALKSIANEIVTDWIEIIIDYTGKFFMPEVGDQVTVVFVGNNSERGLVIGGEWGQAKKPPVTGENPNADLNKDGENNMRFVKSRKGNMIVFDDTKGKEKLQMIASGGKTRFEFSAKDKKLSVKSDLNISVTCKKKINIKSESASLKSKKIFGMKSKEIEIKGSKGSNVKASQNVGLKGSTVALN